MYMILKQLDGLDSVVWFVFKLEFFFFFGLFQIITKRNIGFLKNINECQCFVSENLW